MPDVAEGGEVARSFIGRLIRHRGFAAVCLAGAAVLFVLNTAGMIIPLRNPDIYHEPRNIFTNDITLTAEEFWRRVPRHAGEATPDYARRMTETVADGIAHIQQTDRPTLQRYHWEIPIWENYLIWASRRGVQLQRWMCGTLEERGSAYQYQFSDCRRAVERGVGHCATHSFVLNDILKSNGIRTQIVNMGQHAFNRAEVAPGAWWVLDPDFGVAVPYDLAELREHPHLIEPYYTTRGHNQQWLDLLRRWYSDPSPLIFDTVSEAQGRGRYYFEYISYYLIWIIPAVLVLTGVAGLRRGAANKHSNASSSGGRAGTHSSIFRGKKGGVLSERVRRRPPLWRVTTLRISKTSLWQDFAGGNMRLNELDWPGTLPGGLNDGWVLKKFWCAVAAVSSAVIWSPIC